MVGIDWFGYSEKHLSQMSIQFGNGFGILGEGAWLFFLVKVFLQPNHLDVLTTQNQVKATTFGANCACSNDCRNGSRIARYWKINPWCVSG